MGAIMNDTHTYLLQLNGQADIDDLNANSPLEMKQLEVDGNTSIFVIHTDQSGLIGMLRHLHARGLVLLSVACNPPDQDYLTHFTHGDEDVNENHITPDIS